MNTCHKHDPASIYREAQVFITASPSSIKYNYMKITRAILLLAISLSATVIVKAQAMQEPKTEFTKKAAGAQAKQNNAQPAPSDNKEVPPIPQQVQVLQLPAQKPAMTAEQEKTVAGKTTMPESITKKQPVTEPETKPVLTTLQVNQ